MMAKAAGRARGGVSRADVTDDDGETARDLKTIRAEDDRAKRDAKRAVELWSELEPLLLRTRDIDVLAWIAGPAPRVAAVKHLLTIGIAARKVAFREDQGGGGATTNNRKRLENW